MNAWSALLEILFNPGRLIFGGWEFFLAWLMTRRWLFASAVGLLPLSGILFMLVASLGSTFRSQEAALEKYWTLVDAELTRVNPPEERRAQQQELLQEDTVTPYAEVLLQRVMRLDQSSTRANYLVAAQLATANRIGQARMLMRQIASETASGFPAAHAWLAVDRVTRLGVNSQAEKNTLLHDLEIGARWSGLSSAMRSLLADLYVSEGRPSDALNVLEFAADTTPRLWLKYAAVAKANNRMEDFERAAQKIRNRVNPSLADKTAEVIDFADLANLALLEQKYDEVVDFSNKGLRLAPEDPTLKRTLSEAYRLKYVVESNFDLKSFKLELLDAALKADGSNPGVTQEIAKIIGLGEGVPGELDAALKEKLTAGQATAVTHVLLANRRIADGQLPEAIGHLQIALQISPASPIIMNNLGVAIARNTPNDMQKLAIAEQLLETALRVSGPNSKGAEELFDSLGEIRLTAGKTVEAIESLEAALGRDNTRLNTRRKLAVAYRKVGLDEIAEIQEAYIAEHSQP
jgi:tetratricopeptide (TPR) repeat protein